MRFKVMFFAAVLHAKFEPFEHHLLNKFEMMSLFVSTMTFFLGICTTDIEDSYNSASLLALTLNVLYLFLALPLGLHLRQEIKVQNKISKMVLSLKDGENAPMAGNMDSSETVTETFTSTEKSDFISESSGLVDLGLLSEDPAVDEQSNHSINRISPRRIRRLSFLNKIRQIKLEPSSTTKKTTGRIRHVRAFSVDI